MVLREKTSKKHKFIAALGSIVVHSTRNYDCPEFALGGIEKALLESRPGSYLFVFTDASAKDYERLNEIKSLCEKKQSQVGHSSMLLSYFDVSMILYYCIFIFCFANTWPLLRCYQIHCRCRYVSLKIQVLGHIGQISKCAIIWASVPRGKEFTVFFE